MSQEDTGHGAQSQMCAHLQAHGLAELDSHVAKATQTDHTQLHACRHGTTGVNREQDQTGSVQAVSQGTGPVRLAHHASMPVQLVRWQLPQMRQDCDQDGMLSKLAREVNLRNPKTPPQLGTPH